MQRTARASAANICYHVLNQGNNRACVFHQDGDFRAFVDLLSAVKLEGHSSVRPAERAVRLRAVGSADCSHFGT